MFRYLPIFNIRECRGRSLIALRPQSPIKIMRLLQLAAIIITVIYQFTFTGMAHLLFLPIIILNLETRQDKRVRCHQVFPPTDN
jgi:hypothetical protein